MYCKKKDCIQYNLIKDIDSLFCLEVYYECKQIVYNLILCEVKIMILSLMTEKELEILDFPCNQFGHQAPGTNEEIHTFCKSRFGIQFPQYG